MDPPYASWDFSDAEYALGKSTQEKDEVQECQGNSICWKTDILKWWGESLFRKVPQMLQVKPFLLVPERRVGLILQFRDALLLFFSDPPAVRLYREIVLPKTPNTLLLRRRATLKESWNFCFESLTYRAILIVYTKWKWAQPTSLVTEKWESLPLGVLYRPFSCFLHITKGPPSTFFETTFSKIEPKCSYRAHLKCPS